MITVVAEIAGVLKAETFVYWEDADEYGTALRLESFEGKIVPNAPKIEALAGREDYQRSYFSNSNRLAVCYGTGEYRN